MLVFRLVSPPWLGDHDTEHRNGPQFSHGSLQRQCHYPEASVHQHSHRRKHRGHKERMTAGQLRERPHITVFHTQNEGPDLEGLSPVRLEMEPDKRRIITPKKRTSMGFDSLIPEQMNISPGAETPAKAIRRPTGRNIFGGHIVRTHDEGKRKLSKVKLLYNCPAIS